MFISDAFAQEGPNFIQRSIAFGGLWLPTLVLFLILFIFILRPKQKRLNQKIDKLRNLKRGDEVITSSGIYGKIIKMPTNDTVILEIAKDVEIKIKKLKIAEVL